ncbi:N-acetylmuramoyl-L-alanine amidase family protein [Flagellimonas lutaonensis]|uniref:N-acetylmuramoyl-L-alanine amidase n=1 Tax=Flagellimonas lutaonensis TaxID=516051 RepID=A0A0D5YVX5_9FLAO|nr:N-acetylmuramoyl-L-alanine amidase [Allomuricauda lutaonensis]AKA36051.1 N-acetylmuramoyl-L-alanine amidase [Allomuricauda lutaonensis]MAU26084.1 N-acetylmuramoyl-L-alanine amidase [Allomuricauda sp.]
MTKNKLFLLFCSVLVAVLTSFTKNNTELPANDTFVVVLDAGHGGHDPGNLGNGYLEKNIALNIVLKAGAILEKNTDVKVIYTRKDDSFVDLYIRGKIANDANADLFVSVHCDSHNSDAHGAGTFVLGLHANKQNFEVAKKENSVIYLEDNYEEKYAQYDINSPESVIGLTIMQEEFLDQSIQLAKLLQDNFTKKLKRKDRKVKQAGFIVLHQTFMPSVLIEAGFLTNKSEGAYLNSTKGQQEMARAIADAILTYKENVVPDLEEPSGTPPVAKETVAKATEPPKAPAKQPDVEEKVTHSTPPPSTIDKKPVEVVENKKEAESLKKAAEVEAAPNVVFKIQLMASSKVIPLDGDNFNGLNTLSKEPYKNLYRYMYGETNSYLKAKLLKKNADAKGYTTSYIVAYKDGVRVPLKEALKYAPEQ